MVKNTTPFVPGRVYYFRFGNVDKVSCLNSIKIIEGSTAIPQLGDLNLNDTGPACVGSQKIYRVIDPPASSTYFFLLNGDTVADTDTLAIDWTEPGVYELCVTADNPCSDPVTSCYDIVVNQPETLDTTVYLCPGDCYLLGANQEVCTGGIYESIREGVGGCITQVTTTVIETQPDTTVLLARVCSGDTLSYLGEQYFQEDTFSFFYTNARGCDSIVVLQVEIESCPLDGIIAGQGTSCYAAEDGSLSFSTGSGAPPFAYQYARLGGGPSGSGAIAARDQITNIAGLPAGTYLVEITDDFGSAGYLNVELIEPDALTVTPGVSDFGGFNVACYGEASGSIELEVAGGVAGYTASWLDDSTTTRLTRDDLDAGRYPVTVTDANGCEVATSIDLLEPPPLKIAYEISPEECGEIGSGKLEAVASGGVGPYTLSLRSTGGQEVDDLNALSAGDYRLIATDANQCTTDTVLTIERPRYTPVRIIGPSGPVKLGQTVELRVATAGKVSVRWFPPVVVDCDSCYTISFTPTEGSPVLVQATSPSGCVAEDSIYLEVLADYSIFVPNAFSPNSDGNNDHFLPYTGNSVQRLLSFEVYDRWGGKVFEVKEQPAPLSNNLGWDGSVRGVPANTGPYFWTVTVQFLDGHSQRFSGEVALVR